MYQFESKTDKSLSFDPNRRDRIDSMDQKWDPKNSTSLLVGLLKTVSKKKISFLRFPFSGFFFHFQSKYHKFHDCFMNVLEDDEQCQTKIDTISEFLRLVIGNLIENNCGEYNNESDRCSRIDSIIEKPSNRTIPNDQNRSIMYAIYNVLDS